MTYPIYGAEWHLSPAVTAAIFAIYPIVVVAVLILLGDISDYIGRRTTMLYGMSASMLGVLLFAVAPNIYWVFAGRILMGIGVGLSASPSAAAMVEFSPAGQSNRAGAITTAAQALGLALAMLVGGGLIQYAPYPTRTDFWVLLVVLAVIFTGTWFLPRHTAGEASGRWRIKVPYIPRSLMRIFILSALAGMTSYATGAIMISMGAQIAKDLIGSSNTLVNGAAIALMALATGVVGVMAGRWPARQALQVGGLLSVLGLGLLAWSVSGGGLMVFLAAVVAVGASYGLLFLGGLNLLNACAPVHHRAGTLSAFFLAAYFMQGAFAFSLGLAATAWGLQTAIYLAAGVLSTSCLVIAGLAFSTYATSSNAPR